MTLQAIEIPIVAAVLRSRRPVAREGGGGQGERMLPQLLHCGATNTFCSPIFTQLYTDMYISPLTCMYRKPTAHFLCLAERTYTYMR